MLNIEKYKEPEPEIDWDNDIDWDKVQDGTEVFVSEADGDKANSVE